jgi:HK97 gp10 family phage protein
VSSGGVVTDIRVDGLDEILDMLKKRLPEKLYGKALQGALAKAAKPIVDAARSNAPVRTGRLRKAIYSFRDKQSTRSRESRLISVRRGKKFQKTNRDAYYWKFVEFGHHTRAGKSGTAKVVPPRPFMRPAFEANKLRALQVFQDEVRGQIDKVAQRAAQRSARRLGRGLRKTLTGF